MDSVIFSELPPGPPPGLCPGPTPAGLGFSPKLPLGLILKVILTRNWDLDPSFQDPLIRSFVTTFLFLEAYCGFGARSKFLFFEGGVGRIGGLRICHPPYHLP